MGLIACSCDKLTVGDFDHNLNIPVSGHLLLQLACLQIRGTSTKVSIYRGSRAHWHSGIDGVGEGFVIGSKHCFVGIVNLLLDVREWLVVVLLYRLSFFMKFWIIVDNVACPVGN